MKLPLEIAFRNVERSEALERRIRSKAAKLDQFFDRIMGCRVVVEAPHRHSQKGSAFEVHIELSVPGDEIVVHRSSAAQDHESLAAALRDAFSAAQRQLQSYAQKRNAATSHTGTRITETLGA